VPPAPAASTAPARSLLARQTEPIGETIVRRLDDEGWTLEPTPKSITARRDAPARAPALAVADRGPDAGHLVALLSTEPTAVARPSLVARLLGARNG
jgi:hypothetical protein